MAEPLVALSRGRLHVLDPAYSLEVSGRDAQRLMAAPLKDRRSVYLFHAPSQVVWPHARRRALAQSRAAGKPLRLIKRFADRGGAPEFELYAAR
jgi:hypothetical protein